MYIRKRRLASGSHLKLLQVLLHNVIDIDLKGRI
jgi:hypothetical protein